MNIILNPGQTNTKLGDITLPAFVNLTGDENLLWKIVNNNGTANFTLPAAITDQAFYVGASGDIAGNNVAAEAPSLGDECRVLLDGTCNPGDQLALSTLNWGRLVKPATGYGSGYYTFLAEQAGQPGQRLLVRRIPDRAFTL
jgi:phage-related tail fiber protein